MSSDLATAAETFEPSGWGSAAARLSAGTWIALPLTGVSWFALDLAWCGARRLRKRVGLDRASA
jgi:hypothetical protein